MFNNPNEIKVGLSYLKIYEIKIVIVTRCNFEQTLFFCKNFAVSRSKMWKINL